MDMTILRDKVGKWISKYKYIVLILIVGIVLMLLPGTTEKEAQTPGVTQETIPSLSVEEQLESILCNIKGAGRVQVMLSVASGAQTIYQTDVSGTDRQETVIITDGNRVQSGLVQQIRSPVYRGAIILCQGADNASICLAIKDAVSKVTGLDSSQISVLKMK